MCLFSHSSLIQYMLITASPPSPPHSAPPLPSPPDQLPLPPPRKEQAYQGYQLNVGQQNAVIPATNPPIMAG